MSRQYLHFVALLLALTALLGIIALPKRSTLQKAVHFHAGFHAYVDGVLQNYSDFKYMLVKPCTTNHQRAAEDQQIEKAHLHDEVGDVVHVERGGAAWRDLFENIRVSFGDKPITGYVNGKEVAHVMSQRILPYDTAVILVGAHGDRTTYLREAVSVEHIKDIEKHSESCGGS